MPSVLLHIDAYARWQTELLNWEREVAEAIDADAMR